MRSFGRDARRPSRETGEFTVNVVDVAHLEAMNASSRRAPPDVDEFTLAGLEKREAEQIGAPYVAGVAAVLERRLEREVELGGAPNTLVIGRVVALRVRGGLPRVPDTEFVDTMALRPVDRLWGPAYLPPGEVVTRSRPD